MVKPATVACPTCQREVPWTQESSWRPFCSKRCRMVDLGAWLSEERAIPGEAAPEAGAADPSLPGPPPGRLS
ncbi:MAG: DNA gyrase inhibitor YacG [Steroidobacteraceae bacterium]